jgi:hypothetical protein
LTIWNNSFEFKRINGKKRTAIYYINKKRFILMKIKKISNINKMFIIFIISAVVFGTLLKNFSANAIAQFLYVNNPIEDAEVLLVEGWIHNAILKYIKEEFLKSSYKYILVSGMEYQSVPVQDYNQEPIESNASSVVQALIDIGIEPSKIKVAACHSTNIHKTFSMAFAAKKWFSLNDPSVKHINLCTAWSHGRKTWCAYKKVLERT